MEEFRQPQQLLEHSETISEIRIRNVVDSAQQLETLNDCDIPPQLGPLTEDHPYGLGVSSSVPVWIEAVGHDLSRGRDQNPGHHLDCGRFSRPIRSDVADKLSFLDGEVDAVHSGKRLVAAVKEILDSAPYAFPASENLKFLAQVSRLNHHHALTPRPRYTPTTLVRYGGGRGRRRGRFFHLVAASPRRDESSPLFR